MNDNILNFDQNATVGYDQFGLPITDGTSVNASVNISNPDQSSHSGLLSSLESFGSNALNSLEKGAEVTIQAGESAVKTVYQGGKTVVGDVVGGAQGIVTSTTSALTGNIVILLLALGVGIYLVGKSGAVRLTSL